MKQWMTAIVTTAFLAAPAYAAEHEAENMRNPCFSRLDHNVNGVIDGTERDNEAIMGSWKEADRNNDGQLTAEEFAGYYKATVGMNEDCVITKRKN